MAKPIITLNGLKIVIMLGMLVIILTGVRFAADIIVPFILALFIAVILNPLVHRMVRLRIPRVLAITLLIGIIIVAMVLLVAYLGTSLNELARTLPKYRSSLAIPLAKLRSKVKIIATASREDSAQWCRDRGADLVINYKDMIGELEKQGIKQVDYIFCLNDTDGHWETMAKLIAPQGHICTIVENEHPLSMDQLKLKSAALHFELMYTRSMFNTPDMARQGEILDAVSALLDEGKLQTTLSETLHGLSVETLTAAHQRVLEGHMRGKVVMVY